MGLDNNGTLQVLLLWCPPGQGSRGVTMALPKGSCLADALAAAPAFDGSADPPSGWARWGRLLGPSEALADGDELTAVWPLKADPKVARRQRVAQQRKARQASGKKTCWLPA